MAKYIATFSDTIEGIEVNGFLVMTDNDVETYEQLAESISWPFSYKFEDFELEYSNGEELLSRIEFKELSFDESKMFKRLFNNQFGFFISESYLEQIIGDEDTDFDDDSYDDDDDYDYYNDNNPYDNYDDEENPEY
jgi:hypothetical protein